MNKIEKLPELYWFGFRKEFNGLPGKEKKNMFQFKIEHWFAQFIRENTQAVWQQYAECTESFKQGFSNLVHKRISFGEFSSIEGEYDNSIYVNITVPSPCSVSVQTYLEEQVANIEMLFTFLHFAGLIFIDSDKGKHYRKITIGNQPIISTFTAHTGRYMFSFGVDDDLLRNVNRLLLIGDQSVSDKVTLAINSVIGAWDPTLTEHTRVVLRQEYIEIQIFGDHCYLMGIFGEDGSLTLSTKHTDSPLQLMTLFAVVGCLFDLAENQN